MPTLCLWRSRRDGKLRTLLATDRQNAAAHLGGAFTHLRAARCDEHWLQGHPMNEHRDTRQQLYEAVFDGATDDESVRSWVRARGIQRT